MMVLFSMVFIVSLMPDEEIRKELDYVSTFLEGKSEILSDPSAE